MGKKKYIETPEKMWELFQAYKKHEKSNPVLKMEYRGKDAQQVYYELEPPLSMEGFECYVADQPGMPFGIDQYFSNQDGLYSDYMGICSRIRREIRNDQIKGGMVGIYNTSITQRLNNLVERTENRTHTKVVLFESSPLDIQTDNSD